VGPVVSELQRIFFNVVRGEDADYQDWLTLVPQRELAVG
jgi:hypothetical protein